MKRWVYKNGVPCSLYISAYELLYYNDLKHYSKIGPEIKSVGVD